MIIYQANIVPKWMIKGYDNYIVASDKCIYSRKKRKKLKMQLKQYTKGYYLNGRFMSLSQIRLLLVAFKQIDCPF